MSSSIYTARLVLKTNEEIEICPVYKKLQLLTRRWYMHAASGLLSWSMELLAFASRQFVPKKVDLSCVRFIHIFLDSWERA